MCWIGADKLCIAKQDIPVFKIGVSKNDKVCFSYFQRFKYEVGKIYYSSIIKYPHDIMDGISISEGLHSYSMDAKIMQYDIYINVVFDYKSIELYSINNSPYKLCKINCIIPKGSVYYQNEYGELVSDSLKIDNINIISYGKKIILNLLIFNKQL